MLNIEEDKIIYEDNISISSSQEEFYEDEEINHRYIPEDDPDNDNFIFDESLLDNTEWRMIKIGNTNIRISSTGKVQYMDISIFYVTYGNIYPGTPYRYIEIEIYPNDIRKLFVHDLVWRVFNHSIEDGKWEVRHSKYTPFDENNCYSNSIEYLEVYKKDEIYSDYKQINL